MKKQNTRLTAPTFFSPLFKQLHLQTCFKGRAMVEDRMFKDVLDKDELAIDTSTTLKECIATPSFNVSF